MKYMVIDAESLGLHGPVVAVAYVVVDSETREELDHALIFHDVIDDAIEPGVSFGDIEWFAQNVLSHLDPTMEREWVYSTLHMRDHLWGSWENWRAQGAIMAADVPWPVEAGLLSACIADDPKRRGRGPYPLLDVASVRRGAGFDPLATEDRLPNELPEHSPLADARQSARLLIEALERA